MNYMITQSPKQITQETKTNTTLYFVEGAIHSLLLTTFIAIGTTNSIERHREYNKILYPMLITTTIFSFLSGTTYEAKKAIVNYLFLGPILGLSSYAITLCINKEESLNLQIGIPTLFFFADVSSHAMFPYVSTNNVANIITDTFEYYLPGEEVIFELGIFLGKAVAVTALGIYSLYTAKLMYNFIVNHNLDELILGHVLDITQDIHI